MEAWETLLLAFGGNAVLLAVLVLLAKSLLEKILVRDTKQFETELKAKADAEIERIRSEYVRNIESYKAQLKKSELLFQIEFEAASSFSALYQSILPKQTNPLMDARDVNTAVARDFGLIEVRLGEFLARYGAVLADEERDQLTGALEQAGYGKFNVFDGKVDAYAEELAGTLVATVKSLHDQLIKRVRDQSSL
jgi:triphosphoribosyl-dephospho-CoA synthetase